MTTQNKDKQEYSAPLIEQIKLDNEISLALESAPPAAPGEVMNKTPEYFNNDPFMANLA